LSACKATPPYQHVVDEIINPPTELQFSLLSEEGKVLEDACKKCKSVIVEFKETPK
jgi:hypothetical protein